MSQGGGSWGIVQKGDEHLHWFEAEGVPIALNGTSWDVVSSSSNLNFNFTGNTLSSALDLSNFASGTQFNVADLRALKVAKTDEVRSSPLPRSGTLRHLVLLVAFSDHSEETSGNVVPLSSYVSGDPEDYKVLFTETLKDHFMDVSRGQLSIEADVSPWLRLSGQESDYGSDTAQGRDKDIDGLFQAAIEALNESTWDEVARDGSVTYDWLTVIHSGKDQSCFEWTTGFSDRIWSSTYFPSSSLQLFGGNVSIDRAFTAAAMGGENFNAITDLGVLNHEIGHLLGLPDLYEYQETKMGIGAWGTMGLGAWGLSGDVSQSEVPSPYCAWSKKELGWVDVIDVDTSGNAYSLGSVKTTHQVLKFDLAPSSEYFLIEYLKNSDEGWAGAASNWNDGALIWHVDESSLATKEASAWLHPIVKLEEADGDDSLGLGLSSAESGDLWSSSTLNPSFAGAATVTGGGGAYTSSEYYSRVLGDGLSPNRIEGMSFGEVFDFDYKGPKTKLTIYDYAQHLITWLPIEGASAYQLQRRDSPSEAFVDIESSTTSLSYDGEDLDVEVDYEYRIRGLGSNPSEWSQILPFKLSVSSIVFDPQAGTLALTWNLPILLSGGNALDLSGLKVVDIAGDDIFHLEGGLVEDYLYYDVPYVNFAPDDDELDASYVTGNDAQNVLVHLSDAQRYEFLQRSSLQNNNLYLNIDAGMATAVLQNGSLSNPSQVAIPIDGNEDSISGQLTHCSYSELTGELKLYFDEPLMIDPQSLDYSDFELSSENDGSLVTDLSGSSGVMHSNTITLTLNESRRLRSTVLAVYDGGHFTIAWPNSIKDFSDLGVRSGSTNDVVIELDTIVPEITSFSLDCHRGVNEMRLVFSERVYYSDISSPPKIEDLGVILSDHNGGISLEMDIGGLGESGNAIEPIDFFEDDFGGKIIGAKGAILRITDDEVDLIDNFYDQLYREEDRYFTNPAPQVYVSMNKDGVFTDLRTHLSFPSDTSRWLVNHSIVSSSDYTPRRRLKLLHPMLTSSVNVLGHQDGLIWKWKHQITYEINGGWEKDDRIMVAWSNDDLTNTKGGHIIASDVDYTHKGYGETGASGNLSGNNLGGFFFDDIQGITWDTSDENDALGYLISVYKDGDTSIKYDSSDNALVEVDNTAPKVEISYLSQNRQNHKVNHRDLVKDMPILYDSWMSVERQAQSESNLDVANVLIVATYDEPVIVPPKLTINQVGAIRPTVEMLSASSLNSDNVFFYGYDVFSQDPGNYTDGVVQVLLQKVPDRAVGDQSLLSIDDDQKNIIGNLNVDPVKRLDFSIDTIPPTISSLNFFVEDRSVVDQFSTLRVFFSEDMYVPDVDGLISGEDTPLDDVRPYINGVRNPVTGVKDPDNYVLSQSGGAELRVVSIDDDSFGAGPYYFSLSGVVQEGRLVISISTTNLMDFHGNRVDEAASETSVLWPGPIINNNEVILSVNGRTRLLVSGGFPPYEFKIPEIFQDHAVVSSFDQKSILGLDEGWYTVEIRDSLNYDEPRYVNALVQVPAMTRIGRAFHAYRDPMNYEMVSFPFNLKNWDGGSLVDLLREAGGGVHGTDFILYTFDENNEYVPVDRETLSVGPGYGFWMAYRKNVHPELEAEGPLPDQVVAVDLHSGWNLIGNPFGEKISASNIYISTAGTRISIDNLAQSETEHDLWSIEIEKPQYQAVEELDPFQGAWLHVNNEDGAELVFYRGEENLGVEDVVFEDASEIPSQMSFEEAKSLGRSKLSDESVVAGPPERPGAFHLSSVSNASSTSGAGPSPGAGGGGCLLKREEGK